LKQPGLPDREPDFVVKKGERWPLRDGHVVEEGEAWPTRSWYWASEDTPFWRVPEMLPVVGCLVWLKTDVSEDHPSGLDGFPPQP
jgi:hypothetical protein